MKSQRGLVITYYGNGKGKTTAALGIAFRALGHSKNVRLIQFIKGPWKSGEDELNKKFNRLTIDKTGIGFVGILGDNKPRAEHTKAAQSGLMIARACFGNPDLFVLILDEVLGAVATGLLDVKDIIDLIEQKPPQLNLILTGRPKIKEIIAASNLVSEIKEIKHPFNSGHQAIRGIDY